jgi:hypothetical protein
MIEDLWKDGGIDENWSNNTVFFEANIGCHKTGGLRLTIHITGKYQKEMSTFSAFNFRPTGYSG